MTDDRKRNYCEDCDWEKHLWFQKEYPRCMNPKYINVRNHSRRESDWERRPFCSHTNSRGWCDDFKQDKMIGSDIMTIFRNLFKGGGR